MTAPVTRDRRPAGFLPGAPPAPPAPGPVIRARISVPRVLAGAAVILVCALAGAVIAVKADDRAPVLATARALPVGHTLTAKDLITVQVAAGGGVATVPAAQRQAVLGRVVAVPLPAATLLAEPQLGDTAAWPPPGKAVVAAPVKPGRAPAGLAAGARVAVLITPVRSDTHPVDAAGDAASPVIRAEAIVTDVSAAADQSGVTVVSLLMPAADAARVAAAVGEPSIAHLAPEG